VTEKNGLTGAIVQARMGSTRLPGKVLMTAAGKPLLGHLLDRLAFSRTLETVVVATSTEPADDAIVAYCRSRGCLVFRGSEKDVLDRFHGAAAAHSIEVVVRITADCPLIDPTLVDEMVLLFQRHRREFDVVTNRNPLTFPDGTDLDVLSRSALDEAWARATSPRHREHVVPFFWESGYRVFNHEDPAQNFWRHRWTLDYPEDFELIRRILEALHHDGSLFTRHDVLAYLERHPDLPAINAKYIPRRPAEKERA
jgi:spore coat polysaccharide biosynthesis protein SpsF